MAGLWQRTGNVTVTNGSRTVTGFGTKWKTGTLPIQKGHAFYGPDGVVNEVDTVVSDTEILLVEAYRGGTLANQPYKIDITRTSTISQFSAELSALVGKYRTWFDSMMTWLTGSGDVGILNPDTGATVTIPSWKKVASEGEGQAARAKVEADRAKIEADRAVTEADRAAGIVALAALPMPDVWAPLSDSLRLITGYGRDVLVGADVVARMVNFSRNSTATYIGKDGQLKTAAANEPRFEREGLLLEGQSSNSIPTSTSFKNASAGVSYEVVSNPSFPHSITRVIKPSGNGDVWTNNAELIAGTVYTASIYIEKSLANPQAGVYYGSNSIAASLVRSGVVVGGLERYTAMFTCQVSGTHQIRFGAYATAFDFVAGCPQIEPLPFASSYIPTAGAAVTRAADICWLNVAGNHFANGTHAFYVSCKNCGAVSTTLTMRFIHVEGVSQHFSVRATGTDRRLGYLNNVDTTFASGVTSFEGMIAVAPGRLSKMGNFTAQTSPTFVTEDVSTKQLYIGSQGAGLHSIFGHVKNLRIWSKPLTNDQIKAVA